jgi:hypothetical protein
MSTSPITAVELSRAYAANEADPVEVAQAALSKARNVPAVFLAVTEHGRCVKPLRPPSAGVKAGH